jgi:hypothetical protein
MRIKKGEGFLILSLETNRVRLYGESGFFNKNSKN